MARRKPAATEVIDQPGTAVAEAPQPRSLWQRPAGPVTFDHPTLQEVAALKEQYAPLAAQIDEPGGYEAVKIAIRHLVPLRTGVDEIRLDAGREARSYVQEINAAGNLLISKIQEIEGPLVRAKEAVDKRAEQEALAKAQAIEKAQREAEEARLAAIKAEEDRLKALEVERMRKQQEEIDRQRAELQAERDKQAKLIAEQRRLLDEQQKRYEAQQAEHRERDRQAREATEKAQREAQAKIDEANRQIEAAKQAELDKEMADAFEERRLSELAEARKQAAEEALLKQERERILAEKERHAKAEKERLAAEKKAAQAPDKEKLQKWALSIENIEPPKLKTKEASEVLTTALRAISVALDQVEEFVGVAKGT